MVIAVRNFSLDGGDRTFAPIDSKSNGVMQAGIEVFLAEPSVSARKHGDMIGGEHWRVANAAFKRTACTGRITYYHCPEN
jgi:hypothetical protein